MRQKSRPDKAPAEDAIKDIRRGDAAAFFRLGLGSRPVFSPLLRLRHGKIKMLQAMIVQDRTPESSALRKRLNGIAREGYEMVPSETIGGVIDLAFPVFDQDGYANASLVVPLLPVIGRTPDPETVKAKVSEAAQRISTAIGGAVAASGRPTPLSYVD